MLFLAMLLLGAVIGFVGAGGAGVTIAMLVVGFHVPMHEALAVALTAMIFTCLSGAYSHFKEGEVVVKTGAVLGIGGCRAGAVYDQLYYAFVSGFTLFEGLSLRLAQCPLPFSRPFIRWQKAVSLWSFGWYG